MGNDKPSRKPVRLKQNWKSKVREKKVVINNELAVILINNARAGDKDSFDTLFHSVSNIAMYWAKKLANSHGSVYHDVDEMYTAAIEVLPKAVEKFQPKLGKWSSYIRRCFINAMRNQQKKMTNKMYPESKRSPGVVPATWLLRFIESGNAETLEGRAPAHGAKRVSGFYSYDMDSEGEHFGLIIHDAIESAKEHDEVGYDIFVKRHGLDRKSLLPRTFAEVQKCIQWDLSFSSVYTRYRRFLDKVHEFIRIFGDDPHRYSE